MFVFHVYITLSWILKICFLYLFCLYSKEILAFFLLFIFTFLIFMVFELLVFAFIRYLPSCKIFSRCGFGI